LAGWLLALAVFVAIMIVAYILAGVGAGFH
jgi:hypothetical protein